MKRVNADQSFYSLPLEGRVRVGGYRHKGMVFKLLYYKVIFGSMSPPP